VSGQLHAPDALPTGKEPPVHIGWKASRAPELACAILRSEYSLPYRDSNFDPSVVEAVASRYVLNFAVILHSINVISVDLTTSTNSLTARVCAR
jgi:hypothetical protein